MPSAAENPVKLAPAPVATDEELRADCAADMALLDAVARAASEMALEIQRRTMEAMRDEGDVHGVPSRAVIAFSRVARVQRQSLMLRQKLRREYRGLDQAPPPSETRPGRGAIDNEARIEGAHDRLAEGDDHPDHQVERLAAEAEERLEREERCDGQDPSLRLRAAQMREALDAAADLSGLWPEAPGEVAAARPWARPSAHPAPAGAGAPDPSPDPGHAPPPLGASP